MNPYIARFCSVRVCRKTSLPMKSPVAILEGKGVKVETYTQVGNAIFLLFSKEQPATFIMAEQV